MTRNHRWHVGSLTFPKKIPCLLAHTVHDENADTVLLGPASTSTQSRPEPVFVSSAQQRGAGPNYVGVDTGPSG